jgi:hypothetical protein
VTSTQGALAWSAASMALIGSLNVSAGLELTADFVGGLNLSAGAPFLATNSCAYLAWQGALTLLGGTQCTVDTCVPKSPNGRLTFSGAVNAASFGAYAYNDLSIGRGGGQ